MLYKSGSKYILFYLLKPYLLKRLTDRRSIKFINSCTEYYLHYHSKYKLKRSIHYLYSRNHDSFYTSATMTNRIFYKTCFFLLIDRQFATCRAIALYCTTYHSFLKVPNKIQANFGFNTVVKDRYLFSYLAMNVHKCTRGELKK